MTIGNEPPLTPQQQMRNAITPYEFGVLEGKLHGAHQLLRKKLEKRQQWAVMWIILGGMARTSSGLMG